MTVSREELEHVICPVIATIESQMQHARTKHGPYEWSVEPYEQHIYRACKHLLTWLEQKNGLRPEDGEDHLALGMVRACMALARREYVNGLTNEQDAGLAAEAGAGSPGGGEVEPVGEDPAGPVRDHRHSELRPGVACNGLAGDGDELPLCPSEEGDGRT